MGKSFLDNFLTPLRNTFTKTQEAVQPLFVDAGVAADSIDSPDQISYARNHLPRVFDDVESFDISGKVDTKHFVYKLNEEAIPREARKMGLEVTGKVKTDNGEWWNIKIPKERAKLPVEAFGILPFLMQQNQSREEQPLFIQGK